MAAPVLSTDTAFSRVTKPDRIRPVLTKEQLNETYHVESIAEHIQAHEYLIPCLQFPDNQLEDSANIARAIESKLAANGLAIRVYVLADSSYSPCCVDEIAAQHIGADVLFHFGNACLNPVNEIPVVYVMERPAVSVKALRERLSTIVNERSVLYADTQFTEILGELGEEFKGAHISFPSQGNFIPKYSAPSAIAKSKQLPNRVVDLADITGHDIIYLSSGSPSQSLLLQMTTVASSVTVIDLSQPELPMSPYTQAIRKRYKNVQVAKAAGTIGILVNTLSLRFMAELLDKVKTWVREADKKFYTFVVGKPNVPKLANFEAIDIWVVLGCPLGGLIVDSEEFYRPVITPHELQLALTDSWSGQWVIDLEETLALSTKMDHEVTETEERSELSVSDPLAPVFDAVTGKYTSKSTPLRRLAHIDLSVDDQQLIKGTESLTIKDTTSTAAEYLQSRAWRGLGTEHSEGGDAFAELKAGRSGIARGYSVVSSKNS